MSKVVVIGGGVSGLAVSALLAKRGHKVELFEKNEELGGRGRLWEKDGFRFDMGPSWYMMPGVFEDFLKVFDKKIEDYYKLVRLPVHYRVFFDGGRRYDIKTDVESNISLFEKTEPGSGQKLRDYLAESKGIYDRLMGEMVMLNYDKWKDVVNAGTISKLLRINLLGSFHQTVAKRFKNKDLQKILEFTTVFLGGSPYNTPSFYTLMSHADMGLGLWYPMGGMTRIFEMLESVALEVGVRIHRRSGVDKIIVDKGEARAVVVGGKKIKADIVVSGADYWHTEMALLDKEWRSYKDSYWKKATLSPSAFVVYLGLKTKTRNLEHHNLYFSEDWEKGFEQVYDRSGWPENPSYYVHVPSVTDDKVSPAGGESIMVLVPVAPDLEDVEAKEKSSLIK